MNIASKMILFALVGVLAACGKSAQADVDKAAHDRTADVAKARRDAQPAVDAANRDVTKAQQDARLKISDTNADANREINNAVAKQSKQQAKADYDVAIAMADGDLPVALEKCKMQPADAIAKCNEDASSTHDQSVNAAKEKLDAVNQQAG